MRGYCKAKRKDNGRWIEGYYIYHIKRTPCVVGDCVTPEDEQHLIACDGFSDWNMPRDIELYEVEPETLCWDSGIVDKNGKKIWENDIIEVQRSKYRDFIIEKAVIKYRSEYGFCMQPVDNWEFTLWEEVKVIGNVFDNSELLDN